MKHHMSSYNRSHHQVESKNNWQEHTATCIIQQHQTTSADTNQHQSATVNSIEEQLASHCKYGHPTTTCNIHVQRETTYVLLQHITSSGRI